MSTNRRTIQSYKVGKHYIAIERDQHTNFVVYTCGENTVHHLEYGLEPMEMEAALRDYNLIVTSVDAVIKNYSSEVTVFKKMKTNG